MWLSKLSVHHCRIIEEATLTLSPNINYIYGLNGSGKTSFLEAVSMLSFGRSFRTSRIADVIQYRKNSIIVSALLQNEVTGSKTELPIGIEKSTSKTIIRVNKQTINTQSELSRRLPFTIIHPLSHQLITGASSLRRSYIDWMAFYRDPEFHELWRTYSRLLIQRNAALKQPRLFYALEHLTHEICKLQLPIHQHRMASVKSLQETFVSKVPDSLSFFLPDIKLTTGLPVDVALDMESLLNYYNSVLPSEQRKGRTLRGVHTANLEINLNQKPASSSASRGQIKMISILLNICQSLTLSQHGILAIDDLTAEIDNQNYKKIIDYISTLDRQTFITSTEAVNNTANSNTSLFHVEHGKLKECLSGCFT